MKKLFPILFFTSFGLAMLSLTASALEYKLPFLGGNDNPTPCEYIRALYIWGLGIVGAVAVTSIAIGGFLYMTNQVQKGKDYILSALLGLLLLLGSWLLLNTINPDLAKLKCDLPAATASPSASASATPTTTTPLATPTPQQEQNDFTEAGVDHTLENRNLLERNALSPESTLTTNNAVNQSTVNYVNNAPAAYLNGVENARVAAIIQAESSGDTNAVHTDVDGKSSYGLMQIRVGTARELDPQGTNGLSDSRVADRLTSDPNYNINLGTKYYSDLTTRYNGDTTLAHAAYNGGPMANNPSVNCPNQARWQCEWDNNAHTVANTGYAPTRAYTNNINTYVNSFR